METKFIASSTGCFLSEGKDKRLVEIRRNFYLGGVNGNQVHRFIYRVFFLSEGKDKRLVEIRRNFHLGGVNGKVFYLKIRLIVEMHRNSASIDYVTRSSQPRTMLRPQLPRTFIISDCNP